MYPLDRMRRRVKLSLLPAILLYSACGGGESPGAPDLPASVSPGWSRKSLAKSAVPGGVPDGGEPQCWKAEYEGSGKAEVWACGYRASGSAFDAAQRARAEADTVKFQESNYLVIVKWSGGSRTDLTALVRSIQKNLHGR